MGRLCGGAHGVVGGWVGVGQVGSLGCGGGGRWDGEGAVVGVECHCQKITWGHHGGCPMPPMMGDVTGGIQHPP